MENKKYNEYLQQNRTFNDKDEASRRDWFVDQYEKVIGKPLPRKELTTDEVLRRLQQSAKHRRIKEAKKYKPPVPRTGTVLYLDWRDPQIMRCSCPDQKCNCRGAVMLLKKKIPRGERYIKSSLGRKLMRYFKKPPPQNFMQRLAEEVGFEASKDLEQKGTLSIRGAEFCTSRCIRFYGAGYFQQHHSKFHHNEFLEDKPEIWDKSKTSQEDVPDTGEDHRICDKFSCTESTQTNVGPDGTFIIGDYSHVIFGSLNDTVMRDIEGTKLHIAPYYKDSQDDSQSATDDNFCSLNKLLSWRKAVNFTQLKNCLSLLKRNIISSILEIKGTNTSERNMDTKQQEEMKRKSSKKIFITAPYKEVVTKVEKELQDCTISSEVPPKRCNDSCKIMFNIFINRGDNPDLSIELKQKTSMATELTENISLHEITVQRQGQIDPRDSKKIYSPLINEQIQEQKEQESNRLLTGVTSNHIKCLNQRLENQDHISIILTENKEFDMNKMIITQNDEKIPEQSNKTESIHFIDNQIESNSVLEETAAFSSEQTPTNLSQHLVENDRQNILKSLKESTVTSKDFNIRTLENEEHTKCDMRCNFQKRLHGLSFEHFRKTKNQKFTKSFSYSCGSHKIADANEIQTNKKIMDSDLNQKKDIIEYLNHKKKSKGYANSDSNFSEDLNHINTSITEFPVELVSFESISHQESMSNIWKASSIHEQFTPQSLGLKSITDIQVNYLKLPKEKEECELNKKPASINDVCKIAFLSNDTIFTPLGHRSRSNTCITENQQKNGDDSIISQLDVKKDPISQYNDNLENVDKFKQIPLISNHQNVDSLPTENKLSKERIKIHLSIIKRMSSASLQLKNIIWKKIKGSVKCLSEQILRKNSSKLYNAHKNVSEVNRVNCTKITEKGSNEPKSSETEVISIQYSDLRSGTKRSSNTEVN